MTGNLPKEWKIVVHYNHTFQNRRSNGAFYNNVLKLHFWSRIKNAHTVHLTGSTRNWVRIKARCLWVLSSMLELYHLNTRRTGIILFRPFFFFFFELSEIIIVGLNRFLSIFRNPEANNDSLLNRRHFVRCVGRCENFNSCILNLQVLILRIQNLWTEIYMIREFQMSINRP